MSEVLNLSGANLKGFDPFDAGKYPLEVTNMEKVFTKSEDGKLPQGTPGWNVRFTVVEGQFENRHVWNNYWLPTDEYYEQASPEDKKKVDNMRGMFGKFLLAVGYAEKQITSGKFKLDPEDVIGRKLLGVVGIQRSDQYDDRNVIKNVKPLQTLAESGIL